MKYCNLIHFKENELMPQKYILYYVALSENELRPQIYFWGLSSFSQTGVLIHYELSPQFKNEIKPQKNELFPQKTLLLFPV